MTEAFAWINQIRSDGIAANVLSGADSGELRCQVVAKYQQIAEESIRAAEAMLFAREPLAQRARFDHYPEGALNKLSSVPGASVGLSNRIKQVFTPEFRTRIAELCRLAPSGRPDLGQPFRKNTEYPFNVGNNLTEWTAPASVGSFTTDDLKRFKYVADRLHKFAEDVFVTSEFLASNRFRANV